MSSPETQANPTTENKPSDKELNFRRQEQMYQRMLAEKEARIAELQTQRAAPVVQEDDTDDEPYVDHKRLNKTLSSFERKLEEKIEKKAEEKARSLIQRQEQDNWLRSNNDFNDVMQHAEKFAQSNPVLAETILKMPDTFERQQLVYNNIKALNLHRPPEAAKSSIQDKVDANRRSPYYQPSGVGTAPYNGQGGDFSAGGQKAAYDKMQQLKKQLRI